MGHLNRDDQGGPGGAVLGRRGIGIGTGGGIGGGTRWGSLGIRGTLVLSGSGTGSGIGGGRGGGLSSQAHSV